MPRPFRILYAVQADRSGQVRRAREIVRHLKGYGEVDIFLSGPYAANPIVPLPDKYRSAGLTLIYDDERRLSFVGSALANNPFRLWREIRRFPAHEYDLIVNDTEPITAWAARMRGVPCAGVGRAIALRHPQTQRPPSGGNRLYEYFVSRWLPYDKLYPLHFLQADGLFTPVVRREVRELEIYDSSHYTVFLPSLNDEQLYETLSPFEDSLWEVFSFETRQRYRRDNVSFYPMNEEDYLDSLASCKGVLAEPNFDTVAEALCLGKKAFILLNNPDYLQQCNAAALEALEVPVLRKTGKKFQKRLRKWIAEGQAAQVDYPDRTDALVRRILSESLGLPTNAPVFVNNGQKGA